LEPPDKMKVEREMSTAVQILANRQNAGHSTGPKTPEGKQISSRNATRHGLTGVFNILPHENAEDFHELAARVRDEFQPESENEKFLVDQMIQDRCRLLRIQRLEALAFEQILTEPGSGSDPDARILGAICASGNALDKLQRYAAAAERSYYKALRELQNSRQLRNEPKSAMPSASRHAIQNEPNRTGHRPLDSGHCLSPNEPNLIRSGPALNAA
jgi:hypothetical protein